MKTNSDEWLAGDSLMNGRGSICLIDLTRGSTRHSLALAPCLSRLPCCLCLIIAYRSQSRIVQLPIIQRETSTTMRQVPGQIVMSVFSTKRVLKFIRFKAPMLRDDASVKSLLCSNITRQMRYRRRNMGRERTTSTGT